MDVSALVTEQPLDVTPLEEFVQDARRTAVVTYSGLVQQGQSYEAHPEAQRLLEEACLIVSAETGLRVAAAHRTGSLAAGDIALVASVAAVERAAAFDACQRLVEIIELTVPIWVRTPVD